MCLLVFSFHQHPRYPLIFAGNRDEFHRRPAAEARFWPSHPGLLAGKDLQAGGTWLGVNKAGAFATVTNYREAGAHRPDARSRGDLVADFLVHNKDQESFVDEAHLRGEAYNGFNLILGNATRLCYLSNRNGAPRSLEPGLYGLSNGWLDTPWPKVRRAKALFGRAVSDVDVDPGPLLDVLRDEWRPPDEDLPRTGLDTAIERRASSIFISDSTYGTRASTVVLIDLAGTITFVERSYGPNGEKLGSKAFRIERGEAESVEPCLGTEI